jgi:hypothetical protein
MTPGLVVSCLAGVIVAGQPGIATRLDCPSARDIASQLSVLMPDDAQPGRVVVDVAPDGLLVGLHPDDTAFSATRVVAVGDDCDERARAVAVVISTWWPVAGAPPPRPEDPGVVAVAPVPVEPRRRRLHLGAGAFASMVGDGIAAGGRLEAGWLPRPERGFGLRAAVAYTAAHESALGRGQATWSRAAVELGPSYSLGHARLDAGAVGSRIWSQGSGFDVSQSAQGSAVGATLGLRKEWTWRRLVPWLEVRGCWWPESQSIFVVDATTGDRTSHPLPHAELQLGGGVALEF